MSEIKKFKNFSCLQSFSFYLCAAIQVLIHGYNERQDYRIRGKIICKKWLQSYYDGQYRQFDGDIQALLQFGLDIATGDDKG